MCLLVACMRAETAGHLLFTFEMLYDTFNEQVRASTAAPVQINGGSIGMMRCSREVLMSVSYILHLKSQFRLLCLGF